MRRISTLTVLFLVLLFAMPTSVLSLDKPWNFTNSEKPDGDDHPWGGEDQGGDPVSSDGKGGLDVLFTTGSPTVDYTIQSIYIGIRSWFYEASKREQRFHQIQETKRSRILTAKSKDGR